MYKYVTFKIYVKKVVKNCIMLTKKSKMTFFCGMESKFCNVKEDLFSHYWRK